MMVKDCYRIAEKRADDILTLFFYGIYSELRFFSIFFRARSIFANSFFISLITSCIIISFSASVGLSLCFGIYILETNNYALFTRFKSRDLTINRSQLNVTDLQSLQSALKGLTTQLKRFSLDSASIKSHAAEIIEQQRKEKEKKDLEKENNKFKYDIHKIDEFLDGLFCGMEDILEVDSNFGSCENGYCIEQYLVDKHATLVDASLKKK